jgi:ATP-binding cassette subfamily F protein 3
LAFDDTLAFEFNFKQTPAKIMLEVDNLSFGYSPQKILFKDISFNIKKGECIGIIGKNGKGKSTLLNTLARELTPISGDIHSHPSVEFAHFGQTNIARLTPNATVSDEIHSANIKLSAQTIRAIAGAMMFSGDSADKKISLLSGGEKSRVMLGQILAREVNLLFLDEPTNHLDMESIEALTEAIQSFEGAVIIVTHSEEMLRRVCDRLIIFAKDGAEYFDGGYDEFLEKIGWEEDEVQERVKSAPKSNTKENKKLKAELVRERNKQTSSLKKKVQKLEDAIVELEEELEIQHQELIEASNSGDSALLMELSKTVSQKEAKVEEMFEELEENQNKIDDINSEYEERMKNL